MSTNHTTALKRAQLLANQRQQLNNEIINFSQPDGDPNNNGDLDVEEVGPIFTSFAAGGAEALKILVNFTPIEFHLLYDTMKSNILINFNAGQGKKKPVHLMDALFMVVTFISFDAQWDELAWIFSMKMSNFQCLV